MHIEYQHDLVIWAMKEGMERFDVLKEELEGATSEVDEPFGEASYDVKPSDEWLRRMADAEDKAGSISVGGLAFSAGELVESPEPSEPEETHES